MSSPARSWSASTALTASTNCSRYAASVMASENGRPFRLCVYQLGRGQEPVTVVGRMRSFVAVSMAVLSSRAEQGLSRAAAQSVHELPHGRPGAQEASREERTAMLTAT